MDLDQFISLEPSAFKKLIEGGYLDDHGIWIVDVYNALIERAAEHPAQVEQLAASAVEAYLGSGLFDEATMYLELQVRALLTQQKFRDAVVLVERIADLESNVSESTVLELADDILASGDSYGVGVDQRPRVMAEVARLLQRYGQEEKVVALYLEAAEIYSGHGATQPAYRCLHDAEILAHSLRSLELIAHCYATALIIACEEDDYPFGVEAGERALSVYQELTVEPPPALLGNLGVAYMNTGNEEKAIEYCKIALASSHCTVELSISVRGNLSICLRRCGRLADAEAVLAQAEAAIAPEGQRVEAILEVCLSGAKLAAASSDAPKLAQRLSDAARHLDEILSNVLRLHHRRGIRTRYICRIESLLRDLPSTGNASEVLLPMLAVRGNAMGDWLTILGWVSKVAQSRSASDELIERLNRSLLQIRAVGAPHLYGFREKWDDAWSAYNRVELWDEFSNIAAMIRSEAIGRPLDLSSAESQAEVCRSRLIGGHCLMMVTYAGETALLWCFIGDKYKRVEIPLELLKEWHVAQLNYAQQFIYQGQFISELGSLISGLAPILDPVFVEVADAGCKSIRFIEDCLNDVPLIEFALRNSELSARMSEGHFEVRTVPALIECSEDGGPISSTIAIVDQQDDLLLASFEAKAFTQAAGLPPAVSLTKKDESSLEEMLQGYDALVVSTHGHSIKFFSDAYFAQLGTPENPHLLSVQALQVAAPTLRVQLALVNTCFSGTRSTRNFQTNFRTSDSVALPNLFLLNQRAIALAGSWKSSDTACFVLTYLVGEGLKLGFPPSAALARAIARLRTSTRTAVIEILESQLSGMKLEEAISRIVGAPEIGMFSSPYFTAGLTIHGLL
ncbi:UNVERIFIED_ORG: tetratricopeptide (TPR) repeat protein [Pseudomonas fluorescens]|nr:tetratricopeptide (TPR) repeat protein [Pseudomonas fluorescens]